MTVFQAERTHRGLWFGVLRRDVRLTTLPRAALEKDVVDALPDLVLCSARLDYGCYVLDVRRLT